MTLAVVIALLVVYILGVATGLNYRLDKDTDDMLNDFAETEHLRNENQFLKKQIELLKSQLPEEHDYYI